MDVGVGQKYRDTCGDAQPGRGKNSYSRLPGGRNLRVIEILELLPNGVRASVMTGVDGKPLLKPRNTVLQTKTLRSGYERLARDLGQSN